MAMSRLLKDIVVKGLRARGYDIISVAALNSLQAKSAELDNCRLTPRDYNFIRAFPGQSAGRMLDYLLKSKSQLRQDLFALNELDFKRGGYFVEFGATNGVSLSNTHLMEKEFGWSGILAEPARCWHDDLRQARTASIETRCVWSKSREILNFCEVSNAELSTVNQFVDVDQHSETWRNRHSYNVETISLNDLLEEFKSPTDIDYLSIDTEGSEYQILVAFDFRKYRFKVITVEHNYTQMREKIKVLLEGFGYRRKFEGLSLFDDWYVLP